MFLFLLGHALFPPLENGNGRGGEATWLFFRIAGKEGQLVLWPREVSSSGLQRRSLGKYGRLAAAAAAAEILGRRACSPDPPSSLA